jgi:hypothetical protein
MAGQTDSADDLIAELARLMAEDAQVDKPKTAPASVRIPGGDAPAPIAPKQEAEPTPARPIRIPGDAPQPAPSQFSFDRDRSDRRPPDFNAGGERVEPQASPASVVEPQPSVAAPVPQTPRVEPELRSSPVEPQAPSYAPPRQEPAPPAFEPAASMPDLDQDSLASLIAAELAVAEKVVEAEKSPEPQAFDAEDVTEEIKEQDFHQDRDVFSVPPVFGVAPKPQAHQEPPVQVAPEVSLANRDERNDFFVPPPAHKPTPLPDPLDEIERLIGPAARVQQASPSPSPALRSLATPVIPKREPEAAQVATPSTNPQVSSIEEAILAAAATSGAKVEWVEPAIAATLPPDEIDEPVRAPRNRALGLSRSLAGPIVATLLLAVAAVGLYTVLGLGGGNSSGPAPLLVADSAPVKEVPEPVADTADANQSVVFNEIAGGNNGVDEQIVSRDQSDVEAVSAATTTTDPSQEGLVNRKVRTVTVRPDGTIVSGSDSLAGSAMLPVDRPTVPDVPGADFSTPDLIANADPAAAATQPATTPAAPTVTPVVPGSTVPAVDPAGNPISGKTAPVPLVRPANLSRAAASTPAATLAPAPQALAPQASAAQPAQQQAAAAQPTAPVTSSGNTAPAYVQLSSQRSEEAARQTAQQIVNRFGPLFGGVNLEISPVDLGERGIFYRVRVPADSMQSAMTLCNNVKAAGGDCFTL